MSYELDYIKLNGQLWEQTSFVVPATDVEVEVAFKVVGSENFNRFITVNTDGNGTAYVDDNYPIAGETITLHWEENPAYQLDTVTIDGELVNIIGNSYSFTMPDKDIAIEVTFAPIMYQVSVLETNHGTVTVDKSEAKVGDVVTITGIGDEGYEVSSIQVVDGKNNAITVTNNKFFMPESDVTVSVTFSKIEVKYTITFDPNGGSCSINSRETDDEGKLSSLPSASRSGYSFLGWYTLKSGGSKISTSTVFQEDTTVYARWSYNSSGSGSGGGSSSGGSSSGGSNTGGTTDTSNTEVTQKPESVGNTTTAVATVTTKPVDGKVEVTIDKEEFESLVTDLVDGSNQLGTLPDVVISVDSSDDEDLKRVELTLSHDALELLAETEGSGFTLQTEIGSISFDEKALAAITDHDSEDYTITIAKVDEKGLNNQQVTTVGSNPVYDFSVISDGENVSHFEGGFATVTVPYTPKAGENPNCIYVYYVDHQGSLNKMQTNYNGEKKEVTFKTGHFSVFTVVHELLSRIFTDVKTSAWYFDYVSYAYQNDLFHGSSATTFSPEEEMTRGMLVTTINSYEGKPSASHKTDYVDVPDDQWYSSAVQWASEKNIVAGIGNGEFAPDKSVKREELALILFNYAKEKGYDTKGGKSIQAFADVNQVSHWAEEAMSWAYGHGLITGMEDNTLRPESYATRGQVATILKNFIEKIVE